ncbi:hypothetical protein BDZ97DRAFT_1760699 [Flammula alnicola]|nr:hypothetical protein BDZ97DRAFT_1760699 [Flammula alnicola]
MTTWASMDISCSMTPRPPARLRRRRMLRGRGWDEGWGFRDGIEPAETQGGGGDMQVPIMLVLLERVAEEKNVEDKRCRGTDRATAPPSLSSSSLYSHTSTDRAAAVPPVVVAVSQQQQRSYCCSCCWETAMKWDQQQQQQQQQQQRFCCRRCAHFVVLAVYEQQQRSCCCCCPPSSPYPRWSHRAAAPPTSMSSPCTSNNSSRAAVAASTESPLPYRRVRAANGIRTETTTISRSSSSRHLVYGLVAVGGEAWRGRMVQRAKRKVEGVGRQTTLIVVQADLETPDRSISGAFSSSRTSVNAVT